jgi:hypothetical protein
MAARIPLAAKVWFRIVGAALRSLSPIAKKWEHKRTEQLSKRGAGIDPVFIVGAPRTGSTALYQTLLHALPVRYIDNLACLLAANPVFGCFLSDRLFGDAPGGGFRSDLGNTYAQGLHAPSECGEIWYRWLPRDRHFIDWCDIGDELVCQVRTTVEAMCGVFEAPVLFKNLNAGQRLRLLHKALPGARIIFARRDPYYVAQSILLARRRQGLSDDHFWSVMPANAEDIRRIKDPYRQIVEQVYHIERQIVEDLGLFPSGNVLTVWYEDLVDDWNEVVKRISMALQLDSRTEFGQPLLGTGNQILIDQEEERAIRSRIEEIEWPV